MWGRHKRLSYQESFRCACAKYFRFPWILILPWSVSEHVGTKNVSSHPKDGRCQSVTARWIERTALSARAAIVNVGFDAADVGKTPLPSRNRFA